MTLKLDTALLSLTYTHIHTHTHTQKKENCLKINKVKKG